MEEYEALQQTLDLEQNLRTEAESFAREVSPSFSLNSSVAFLNLIYVLLIFFSFWLIQMLVEQKKLKRQSQLLLQSCTPSQALQDALSQVAVLTAEVERQRLEHHNQVWGHMFHRNCPVYEIKYVFLDADICRIQ